MTNSLTTVCGASRIPFLIVTAACVLLGVATASWTTGQVEPAQAALALIAAVAANVSVNTLNEFFDFRSGLDLTTVRTPFSGGSGALPAAPEHASAVLAAGLVALAVTFLIGLHFVLRAGMALLPLGAVGFVLVAAYTPWITERAWLSLVAPGLGFGTVMVAGSVFALSGSYSAAAWTASLVPFFLVNALLLLNQFPDVEPDRRVGRRNFPIVYGRRASALVYIVLIVSAYVALGWAVACSILPRPAALGFATLVFAVPAMAGTWRHCEDPSRLKPFMGLNVAVNALTPLLMAAGIAWAARGA